MGVRDLIIYQKMYDAALYALPILNRLPKSYRGSLARDLQACLVHLLTGIVAANADPARRASVLCDLDVELEVARVLDDVVFHPPARPRRLVAGPFPPQECLRWPL